MARGRTGENSPSSSVRHVAGAHSVLGEGRNETDNRPERGSPLERLIQYIKKRKDPQR